MKTIAASFLVFLFSVSAFAQEPVRCVTTENEEVLRERYPGRSSTADFEKWMAGKLAESTGKSDRGTVVLPVVFHVIHGGESVGTGNNVSSTLINAQLQQLNDDFRKTPGTAGFNTNPVGADLEVEFCAAAVDPDGNSMPEPGIDRINASDLGISSPPYNTSFMDNTVKPATIWDPEQYINIWITPVNFFFFPVLGYAQFPSASGLPGLNADEGPANSDGVVVSPETVGSVADPNPAGGVYGRGRTLTHEMGHFFGLRHIWGDGGCSVDDFCPDTPTSDGANYGCETGSVSCNSVDMVENYMDYSDDLCMNIFTQDQKARVDVVLANSPRRTELLSSAVCGPAVVPCENPYPAVSNPVATNTQNGILLTWDPIPGSIGCRVRAGLVSVGFQQTVTVLQDEASQFFVPAGFIQNGSDYQWQVQCGCSVNPTIVGPWSETAFFNFGSGISLSSTDADPDSKLSVFPNPATNEVRVFAPGVGQIDVYDMSGRRVEAIISPGKGAFILDLTPWEAGLYLLVAEFPDGSTMTSKLMVE